MGQLVHRSGRDPDGCNIAGSKQNPSNVVSILEAAEAGVQHFGENRVEEAIGKIPEVNKQLERAVVTWHMVGHIQSRKASEYSPAFPGGFTRWTA